MFTGIGSRPGMRPSAQVIPPDGGVFYFGSWILGGKSLTIIHYYEYMIIG